MSINRGRFRFYLILLAILVGVSCTKGTSVHKCEIKEKENFLETYKFSDRREGHLAQVDSLGVSILNLNNTKKNRALLADYIEKTNADQHYINNYITQATIAKDSQDIANSCMLLGNFFNRNFIVDSSYYYFNQAEYHYKRLNDSVNLQKTYLSLSLILANQGVFTEAEDQMDKVISLNRRVVPVNDSFIQNSTLGKICLGLEKYEEAITLLKNALELMDNPVLGNHLTPSQMRADRILISNNLATAYIRQGKFDLANELIELTIYKYVDITKHNDYLLYSMLVHNLAAVKLARGEYDLAFKYIKESFKVDTDKNNIRSRDFTQILLAQYYFETNNTFVATEIIRGVFHKAEKTKDYQMQKEALTVLLQYDTENSKANFKKYIGLNELINKNSNIVKNRFARLKYEADELMKANYKLKSQKDIIIFVSIVIISIILILLVIFFLKHKIKEMALIKMFQNDTERYYDSIINVQNKIANVQEAERKKIARELHDGVLNKLFVTRFSLMQLEKENIAVTRDLLVKEVQDVEKFIRDSSHALSNEEKLFVSNFKQLIIELVLMQNRNAKTKFDVFIDPRIKLEEFSHRYKINIYRIVQEALQNVQKYSKAKNCYVSFTYKTSTLTEISIEDNGKGFNIKTAKRGIGLRNIDDRLGVLNSKLVITSTLGEGTTLLFTVKSN